MGEVMVMPNVKSTANLQGFADGLLHNLGVTP
jgi:hypothetical protein